MPVQFSNTSSGGGGGSANIPCVLADPVSPANGEAWVLKTTQAKPVGLLLALTKTTDMRFDLSINCVPDGIKRVRLI